MKRILSLVMCTLLLLSALPYSAFANEHENKTDTEINLDGWKVVNISPSGEIRYESPEGYVRTEISKEVLELPTAELLRKLLSSSFMCGPYIYLPFDPDTDSNYQMHFEINQAYKELTERDDLVPALRMYFAEIGNPNGPEDPFGLNWKTGKRLVRRLISDGVVAQDSVLPENEYQQLTEFEGVLYGKTLYDIQKADGCVRFFNSQITFIIQKYNFFHFGY